MRQDMFCVIWSGSTASAARPRRWSLRRPLRRRRDELEEGFVDFSGACLQKHVAAADLPLSRHILARVRMQSGYASETIASTMLSALRSAAESPRWRGPLSLQGRPVHQILEERAGA